jgi:AmmeMemoRadiSam system protein B
MGWALTKVDMRYVVALIISLCVIAGAYFLLVEKKPVTYPVGIVVPHHDLVAPARQAYFTEVAAQVQPETIVIISTDHFDTNSAPILVADKTWETILGDLPTDQDLVTALGLKVDTDSFAGEHGITTLLRDTKEYFPNSRIVAIKISRQATYAEVGQLTEDLFTNCPTCLLVASVDFSHSVTAEIAYLHDQVTLRELENVNPFALYQQAEVDSPETLAVLSLWARLHEAKQFRQFSYTNSGFIARRSVGEITSHLIGGYYAGQKNDTTTNTVTMMLAGDTMFARGVATRNDGVFSKLGNRFWGTDIALLNLEGVFTATSSDVAQGWNKMPPVFRFNSTYLSELQKSRLTHVGLSNNHSDDGGVSDTDFTVSALREAGITPIQKPEVGGAVLVTKGSTTIALITESTHRKTTDLQELISSHKAAGHIVVVFAHFGREYEPKHSAEQEALATYWIEAGADLIVGSHPHVVQDVAVYKGKPIIYSLGNFVFDQNQTKETMTGAVLGAIFNESGTELFLTPISSYLQPFVLPESETKALVATLTLPWQTYKTERNTFFFPR